MTDPTAQLHTVSTEALEREIARRKEEERKKRELQMATWQAFVSNNIGHFLALVNEHSRTSCSDTNVAKDNDCPRCKLLLLQSRELLPDQVSVSIQVQEVGSHYRRR